MLVYLSSIVCPQYGNKKKKLTILLSTKVLNLFLKSLKKYFSKCFPQCGVGRHVKSDVNQLTFN